MIEYDEHCPLDGGNEAPDIDGLEIAIHVPPKLPPPGTPDYVFRPDRRLPYWWLQKLLPRHDWPRRWEGHVEFYLVSG